MDLIKIGKHLAQKRKALGMTQRQLAEKLGMSDKSVSKWERGICLPDVSVYSPLCSALGMSLNEFLAGEEIQTAETAQAHFLAVAVCSRRKQQQLTAVICVLLVIGCIWLLMAHRQVTCTGETVIWQVEPYTVIDTPKLKTAQTSESYPYAGKIVDVHGGEWYKVSGVKTNASGKTRNGYISAKDANIRIRLW